MKIAPLKWLIGAALLCALSLFPYYGIAAKGGIAFAGATLKITAGASGQNFPKTGSAPYGEPSASVYGILALLVSCAALGRFGAVRLKQAPVLGELAAGIVVGFLLYQLGSPTVIIIRHSALVNRVALSGLSVVDAQRVERVLLSRDFPSYLSLARSVQLFAGFGVVLLLFMVGLEVSVKELRAIGSSAAMVAACGITITFVL
jgi:Kef-type K+ transport system membrane component KefB